MTSGTDLNMMFDMKILKLNTKRLRAEMDRQNLTYQALGDLLNIERQAVGYYFYYPKKLSLRTINKLAAALNCDPKDLLI